MTCKSALVLIVLTMSAISLSASEPEPRDPIEEQLFPPELIMMHRTKLDLSERQQALLKAELQTAQATFFDLQWQMNDESQKLVALLQARPIDEKAVLNQSDRVMDLERQIKRTHLTLLVRLKNMLSKEQINMLFDLREAERRRERPR